LLFRVVYVKIIAVVSSAVSIYNYCISPKATIAGFGVLFVYEAAVPEPTTRAGEGNVNPYPGVGASASALIILQLSGFLDALRCSEPRQLLTSHPEHGVICSFIDNGAEATGYVPLAWEDIRFVWNLKDVQ
jgi:hypothetical protein